MPDQPWTVVYSSCSWIEASFVATALHGYGLAAMTFDGEICRINPASIVAVDGVKVAVAPEDEADALEILHSALGGEPPYTGTWMTVPMSFLACVFLSIRNALLRPRDSTIV